MVRVCKVWEPHLVRREFILSMDHLALKQINGTTNTNRMHAWWFAYQQKFQFTIKRKAGKLNQVADAFSRSSLLTILSSTITAFDSYKDEEDFSICWKLCTQEQPPLGFNLEEGFIFKDNRLCI